MPRRQTLLPAAVGLALALLAGVPASAADHRGRVEARESGDRLSISVDGVITPDVAIRFRAALAAATASSVVIELDSPGGYVRAGYAVIDAIVEARAAGRAVTTLVRGSAACESMCVGIFMAGLPRRAESGASFMLHAPRDERTGAVSIRAAADMKARLVSLGASAAWIEGVAAKGAFSGALDYRRDAEALAAEGADVVTQLVGPRIAGLP
jgi:ATP-dependent protease ClpP protease subunit